MELHKKYLDGDENVQVESIHSEEDSFDEAPFSNKILPFEKTGKKMNIPKLDLTQAKKIQEFNAKRSTQANNQNIEQKFVDKFDR